MRSPLCSLSRKSIASIREFLNLRFVRNGECIEYTGNRDRNGYGRIDLFRGPVRVPILAHRLAYLLTHGSIRDSDVIRHKCDNPPCINPEHLETGTQADNVADMVSRRRREWACGELASNAKLTEVDVRAMRELARGGIGQREISRRFGVSHTVGRNAIKGNTWRHVN